ncbi:uncharacterized protein LOC143913723 [Arctopsyche grandis]|uniref:uncharacterized protein LOC143913723 n=1 Tax=Arctopsyche grandis TaxID=121162 RepID=UPI00406D68A4
MALRTMPSIKSTLIPTLLSWKVLYAVGAHADMVAVAICCILVLLAVFIVLIIVVGQSMGEPKAST